jgi:3-oxoacyl-[acyl-carrier-protein] synthase-3
VQDRLGLRTSVGALDFNLGCSGYVYGLALAHGLVVSGVASNVLLITAETYTRHIHPQDRSTRTIFGDGAAATLVELTEVAGIGKFVFGTDGRGAENLIVPAGGSRKPRSAETSIVRTDKDGNQRSDENLFMNGMEVFNFTIASVPKLVQETLATNGMIEVDYYVFHQANKFMLDHLRQKCGISESKFYLDVEHTGNTVSATIPIALRMAQESGRLKTGMHVLIAGFGVGYSWGGTTLTW